MTTLGERLATLAEEVPTDAFEEAEDPAVEGREGEIIIPPTLGSPLPGAISERTGKWVNLYETRTGEKRTINRVNLAEALNAKHKDRSFPEWVGKPLFSRRPTVEWVVGQYKCFLHPDQPQRGEYDRRGYPTCASGHLASEYEARRHMQLRHKATWAAILEQRSEEERKEQLEAQRQQTAALLALAGARAEPEGTTVVAAETPRKTNRRYTKVCECGASFTNGSPGFAQRDLNKHQREVHSQ